MQCQVKFLSTLSLRRATSADCNCRSGRPISIHALLAESDTIPSDGHISKANFYPRSPCGERQATDMSKRLIELGFLSTLSLRRATLLSTQNTHNSAISIHALLAESDSIPRGGHVNKTNFYPRSPCGERLKPIFGKINTGDFYPRSPCGERLKLLAKRLRNALFLSTLSLRRATNSTNTNLRRHRNFYPRSPCGERRPGQKARPNCQSISIHALLAESDFFGTMQIIIVVIFLSTLSLRRAT